MGHIYADRLRWDRVLDALQRSSDRGDPAGLDTEFYGADPDGTRPRFDVRKESCAGGRTRVHMWSVAIKRYPHQINARGYHNADAAVLLSDALDYTPIRDWLESNAPKVVHNLSVDDHALFGHGITLGGAVNTLSLARWVWPHRARGAGYALDTLGVDLLGTGKTEGYEELFSEEREEVVRVKTTTEKHCSCGVEKCRKRNPETVETMSGPRVFPHTKIEVVTQTPVTKMVTHSIPLEDVVPGHRLWERAVAYAAKDAVLALGVWDKVEREMRGEVPWPFLTP